jgi:two-component system NtrC family sensor kinase
LKERAQAIVVLVIENETPLRKMMTEALAMRGILVETAAGGSEALEILARVPVRVLVLDTQTPGMSGFDLWSRVKRVDPDLARRTVFCTGDIMVEAIRTFIDSTGCVYIDKPFGWGQFFDAVAEAASR